MGDEPSLRYRVVWLALGGLQLLVVLVIAILPQAADMSGLSQSDDTLHLVTFCGLMIWFAGLFPPRRYLWLLVALIAYAVFIEMAQTLTPNRRAEMTDFIADLIGLAAGLLAALVGLRHWPVWVEKLLGVKHLSEHDGAAG